MLAMKAKETLPRKPAGSLRRTSLLPALVFSCFLLKDVNNAFISTMSARNPTRHLRYSAGASQSVEVMERTAASEQSKEELVEASESLQKELEAAETELRRANAFKLPERDGLRSQVTSLQTKLKQIGDELDTLQKLSEPPAAEPSAEDLMQEEGASAAERPTQKAPLAERLSWENLQAMSNEERMELTQEIGPAFGVSVGIVAFIYWSITLPILLNAYYQSTGEWPRFEEIFSLSDGGRTAGAVAGILGLAALMKPLRIAAAIALTPWTADNVLPLIPWLNSSKKEDKTEQP